MCPTLHLCPGTPHGRTHPAPTPRTPASARPATGPRTHLFFRKAAIAPAALVPRAPGARRPRARPLTKSPPSQPSQVQLLLPDKCAGLPVSRSCRVRPRPAAPQTSSQHMCHGADRVLPTSDDAVLVASVRACAGPSTVQIFAMSSDDPV